MDEKTRFLRRRYQTNLELMITELIGEKLDPCQKVVTDFFVKKDPDIPLEKLDTIKDRLLLYPRLVGKSFLDCLDCVQWIICYPAITIAIQTGDGDLANAFVATVRSYFVVQGWDGKKEDGLPVWNPESSPTKFQKLFPEFCIYENAKGPADSFVTPARKKWDKDPTCFAISITSNNSGWHCNVMKNDDILTDSNIGTPTQCQKIDERFHMSHKLLLTGGYRDTIGTRYDPDDTYGRLMKKRGIKDDMPYGYICNKKLKYLCMPAWWIKGTGADGTKEYLPPVLTMGKVVTLKENVEILSERLTFEFLEDDMELDLKSHSSQYLNNPVMAAESHFIRADLIAMKRSWQASPRDAFRGMVVDLAYSDKKGRDYTCFAIGDWKDDALVLVGLIADRFKPENMGFAIIDAYINYRPEALAIEDTVGAQWLKPSMILECERRGIAMPAVEWIPMGQGETGSKDIRILGLKPLMADGRFTWLDNLECEDLFLEQFTKYKPNQFNKESGRTNKGPKKDVPDAVSRLLMFQHRQPNPEAKEERRAAYQKLKEEDHHDMVFGEGRYKQVPQVESLPEPSYEPEVDEYTGLPIGDIFG